MLGYRYSPWFGFVPARVYYCGGKMSKSPEKLSDNERSLNVGDNGPWGKEY